MGVEGQTDSGFGPGHNGRVVVPFNVSGGLYDAAHGPALQSGARIIVAAPAQDVASNPGTGVLRLNTQGYAGSSFGAAAIGWLAFAGR